jgi:hypothetical protein
MIRQTCCPDQRQDLQEKIQDTLTFDDVLER